MPDFLIESEYTGPVCGLDEAGRGPLAGPVIAACVFVPPEKKSLKLWSQVNDSKTIRKDMLPRLAQQIRAQAHWGIGAASAQEIDAINILQASFLAMRRAYEAMKHECALALIDGNRLPKDFPCMPRAVIRGDSLSVSIAAASILAKVERDAIMHGLAGAHPHYGWDRNVGYPTAEHLGAINDHGATPHHRMSFRPLRNAG